MGAVWSTLVGEAEDGGDESSRFREDEIDGGDLEELTHSEKYRLKRNKKAEQRQMDERDKQRDEDEMDNIYVPGPGATGSGLICKLTVIETAWGRGLATTCPANEGELLAEVPARFILHSRNERVCHAADLRKALAAHPRVASHRHMLAAVLWLLESVNCAQSFWQPYLSELPDAVATVDRWNQEELAEVGHTLMLYEMVEYKKKKIAADYAAILLPFLQENTQLFGGSIPSEEEYRRALSLVYSRTFDFSELIGEHVFIPFVDFLNHSINDTGKAACTYSYNHDKDCFELLAGADYDEGEEVFISYGEKTSSQLLASYGFMYENNAEDTVDITASLFSLSPPHSTSTSTSTSSSSTRRSPPSLKQLTLEDLFFSLKTDQHTGQPFLHASLLNFIRIQHLSTEQKACFLTQDLGQRHDLVRSHIIFDDQNEAETNRFLLSALERMLKAFPTTIEEDEHLLATCEDLTSGKRWAIRYRKEEKRLLRDYIRAYRRYVGMDS